MKLPVVMRETARNCTQTQQHIRSMNADREAEWIENIFLKDDAGVETTLDNSHAHTVTAKGCMKKMRFHV